MNGLFFKKWSPLGEARAVILIVHGAAEHHGRYQPVADWFNQNGIAICAGDLPGLGRSEGLRGHIDQFEDYLKAVGDWIRQTKRYYPDIPMYILGHSLGGLIVTRYAQQFPDQIEQIAEGIILTSPCFRVATPVPDWKKRLAQGLNKVVPRLRMASGIPAQAISRSPEVVSDYRTDRLNYHKVSVRWYQELGRAMDAAWEQAHTLRMRLLLLQAGDDLVVDPIAASEFFDRMTIQEKEIYVFPGCYHELLQEPEKERIFEKIIDWINRQELVKIKKA